MKKFAFSLETLLRHRRNLEERERTILSRIQFSLDNEVRHRRGIEEKRIEALTEMVSVRASPIGQEEIGLFDPYLRRLRYEAELSDKNIRVFEAQLNTQKSVVLQAARNKKIIETLKTRRQREHLAAAERDEQKKTDEIVIAQFGRNKA